MNRGLFITFEGGEGCGKSTHIRMLAEWLREQGREVLQVREPGGTAAGERIREILLDPKSELDPVAELLLYEAARAQIVAEVIKPALAGGQIVLCDRFVDSTVAYQGYGRGLSVEEINRLNASACQGTMPHATILLVDDPGRALKRATKRGADRIEQAGLEFHQRVREGFEALAAANPQRIHRIETQPTKPETQALVRAAVAPFL